MYGPEPTALVRAGRSLGGICLDGAEMLVQQAARIVRACGPGRTAPIDLHAEEVKTALMQLPKRRYPASADPQETHRRDSSSRWGSSRHSNSKRPWRSRKHSHLRIGEILVRKGWIKSVELTEALARRLGVRFLDLAETRRRHLGHEPHHRERRPPLRRLPIAYADDHTLLVAMVDPSNIFAIDDLRILTGFDIEPTIATEEDIFAQIAKLTVAWTTNVAADVNEQAPQRRRSRPTRSATSANRSTKRPSSSW